MVLTTCLRFIWRTWYKYDEVLTGFAFTGIAFCMLVSSIVLKSRVSPPFSTFVALGTL